MSEPITRADYAKWLLSCGDLEMHAMFEDWCAHNPAESASPPRVPGPSAQFAKVGVQSGPGQPIDSLVTLDECPPGLFFFGRLYTLKNDILWYVVSDRPAHDGAPLVGVPS